MSTFLKSEQAVSDFAAAFTAVLPAYAAAARPAVSAQGGAVALGIGSGDFAKQARAAATRPVRPISVYRDRMSATGLNGTTNGKGHRPRELPL